MHFGLKLQLFLVFFSLLFGSVRAFSDSQNSKNVFSLVVVEYPPYIGKDLGNFGPLVEVVEKSLVHMGYHVEVNFQPWARAEFMARTGVADGMIMWKTEARLNDFVFSIPVAENKMAMYGRLDKSPHFYQQKSSLINLCCRFASVRGHPDSMNYEKYFRENYKVGSELQLIKMLAADRVDYIYTDTYFLEYMIKNRFPELKPIILPITESVQTVIQYLAISKHSKRSQRVLSDFNTGYRTQFGDNRVVLFAEN